MNLKVFAISLCLLLLTTFSNSYAADSYVYERKYEIGEKYSYRLSRHYYLNGRWKDEAIGISDIEVVEKSGIPVDVVSWISLREENKDGWTNLDDEAKKVTPFDVSMHKGYQIKIPNLNVEKMIGMVTDLITFFVGASPAVGSDLVSRPGDTHEGLEPVVGRWTNGKEVILGEDCINKKISMTNLSFASAMYETDFEAPKKPCLTMNKPFMNKEVVEGVPNNFQQIRKTGNRYDVMWGKEDFFIRTEVERSSGKILNSQMSNFLVLKMRRNCDLDLSNCEHEFPLTIHRELIFSLID